jgi:hypothetical protein
MSMSGLDDITPAELRDMLRQHALVIGPGEVLVVTLGDSFTPLQCREIYDALSAVSWDLGFRVIVTPGCAVTVAAAPAVEGVTAPMSDPARYGALALTLNSLIDQGETADIEDVTGRLGDGTLFAWLSDTFPDISLGLFEAADLDAITGRFRDVHAAASGERVYGVQRNGLSLLLAWCLGALHEHYAQPGTDRAQRSG